MLDLALDVQPEELTGVDRSNNIGASLIGLVQCGRQVKEVITGRDITVDSGASATPQVQGTARSVSSTTGIYTARRAWTDWEPTSQPFSFIALWYVTTAAAVAQGNMGNTSGSNGYFISERFGNGTRRYGAGGLLLDPAGAPTWPTNTPISSVLTYDGANAEAFFNGKSDVTATGGSACTYDTFCRVFVGNNPDFGELTGGVWYFGLCDRVLTAADAWSLYQDPFQIYRARRHFWMRDAAAAAGNTIAVPAGSLTLTGFAPTVVQTANNVIAVPAGSLALTGQTPSVVQSNNQTVAVPLGTLTLTAQTPTVVQSANNIVDVPLATLSLSAFAPDIPGVVSAPAPATTVPGGVGKSRRRRAFVEIKGKRIAVADIAEAQALLRQAANEAKVEAPKVVAKAAEKARVTGEPIQVEPPKVDLVGEYMSQLGAQFEAAQAEINAAYAQAVQQAEMVRLLEEDDEEAIFVLTH